MTATTIRLWQFLRMTTPVTTRGNGDRSHAEPILWSGCLAVVVVLHVNDKGYPIIETTITGMDLETLSLGLLLVLACRSWALLLLRADKYKPSNHHNSKLVVWRQPQPKERSNSSGDCYDAPGIVTGMLLIPWLCVAMGHAMSTTSPVPGDETHSATEEEVWYLYGILTALFSWMAWEVNDVSSLGVHNNQQQSRKLYCGLPLMVGLLLFSSQDMVDIVMSTGYAIVWHGTYYLLPTKMAHQFLSRVFTQGEWMVVTSLLSISVVHYVREKIALDHVEPTHASVALAGVVAAIVTCPIMAGIKTTCLTELMARISPTNSSTTTKNQHSAFNDYDYTDWINLGLQLPLWFGIPLLGVELLEFGASYGTETATPSTSDWWTLLPLSWIILPVLPKSLQWIVQFLSETEQPLLSTTLKVLPLLPRYGWIAYWVAVLAVTLPLAPAPGPVSSSSSSSPAAKTNTGNGSIRDSRQGIVLARKWFHFIAVLLFGPVTLAAPQLLSLSYAIAFAILLLLECARADLPMIQQFHERYLDPSKDDLDGKRLVISHMALIVGCALPLWISELVVAATGIEVWETKKPASLLLLQLWGVLSLGIGDAMGAIVGVLCGKMQWSRHNARTLEGSLAMWITMMGACLMLGYSMGGDAATAVSTPRIISPFVWHCLVSVSFVTLLEAHTFQVDNLVLPLAGVALLLYLPQ